LGKRIVVGLVALAALTAAVSGTLTDPTPAGDEAREGPRPSLRFRSGWKRDLARALVRRWEVPVRASMLILALSPDGVPWNNNNAENAIKGFASRRRIFGATCSERGLRSYLVFLSLYQTCRHKNLSFLRFLRSGGLDLDAFAEAGGR
jgi:hypothetical protein